MYTEERVNSFEFYARCALLITMVVWGVLIISTDPRVTTGLAPELSFYDPLISDFVLVFHEAGHVIFSFFGRFMTVLGGSLLQWLVPFGLTIAFVYKYGNPFGGAVSLWLLGYSFIDTGPYCYDAKGMNLMLIGGGTGKEIGGHDWNNMLKWTGNLEHHESLAMFFHYLGSLVVVLAVFWGVVLLRRQWQSLDRR